MHGVASTTRSPTVAGYAAGKRCRAADFRHADRGSMLRVKGQDGFLPIGPELTPRPTSTPPAHARTHLNGEVVQESTADDMLWGVAYQLADICR